VKTIERRPRCRGVDDWYSTFAAFEVMRVADFVDDSTCGAM